MCSKSLTPNIYDSEFDEDTYWGRFRHCLQYHNPLYLFVSSKKLEEARCLYLDYKCGENQPESTEFWRAKALYESAFHPKTCQKLGIFSRPSAQIPVDMILAGGIMATYNFVPGIFLWHWFNQTYNTFLSKARADGNFTDQQLYTSYILATGTAIGTALGLRHVFRCTPMTKFVPFIAVAAAHCISVPLMKAQVLKNGTPIYDDCNNKLAFSKNAAQAGINGVIVDKILWAVPPFIFAPFFINYLERRGTLCRYPWIKVPAYAGIAGFALIFLSPLTCAFFNRKVLLPYSHLEPELKEHLCKKYNERPPKYLYYDRAL